MAQRSRASQKKRRPLLPGRRLPSRAARATYRPSYRLTQDFFPGRPSLAPAAITAARTSGLAATGAVGTVAAARFSIHVRILRKRNHDNQQITRRSISSTFASARGAGSRAVLRVLAQGYQLRDIAQRKAQFLSVLDEVHEPHGILIVLAIPGRRKLARRVAIRCCVEPLGSYIYCRYIPNSSRDHHADDNSAVGK